MHQTPALDPDGFSCYYTMCTFSCLFDYELYEFFNLEFCLPLFLSSCVCLLHVLSLTGSIAEGGVKGPYYD